MNLRGWPLTVTTYEQLLREPTTVAMQLRTFLAGHGVVLQGDIHAAAATVNVKNYRNRHDDLRALSPQALALWDLMQNLAGNSYSEFPDLNLGHETPTNKDVIQDAAPIARHALEDVPAHRAQVGAALL